MYVIFFCTISSESLKIKNLGRRQQYNEFVFLSEAFYCDNQHLTSITCTTFIQLSFSTSNLSVKMYMLFLSGSLEQSANCSSRTALSFAISVIPSGILCSIVKLCGSSLVKSSWNSTAILRGKLLEGSLMWLRGIKKKFNWKAIKLN